MDAAGSLSQRSQLACPLALPSDMFHNKQIRQAVHNTPVGWILNLCCSGLHNSYGCDELGERVCSDDVTANIL